MLNFMLLIFRKIAFELSKYIIMLVKFLLVGDLVVNHVQNAACHIPLVTYRVKWESSLK